MAQGNTTSGADRPAEKFHFKVSSALKNLIGRDLITDDFVAIFELVKNSFDAHAGKVDLVFHDDAIFVVDDGKGMALTDLLEKWFFVAYSAKKEGTEDDGLPDDYRHKLKAKKTSFAGNKGVGRFSCDRLGRRLRLQTRSVTPGAHVEVIEVQWDRFEVDAKEEFVDVPLEHRTAENFDLPPPFKRLAPRQGTVLEIRDLRRGSTWDREKLLKLRQALAKLVDPFGMRNDFQISVHAPAEQPEDRRALENWKKDTGKEAGVREESPYRDIVNGEVKNLVFDTLDVKTTKIECRLVDDGAKILTELTDRGEVVYKIKEVNPYGELVDSDASIALYFLNRKAKYNFSRLMGVDVVNFGNVFLFNHGFRVYPFGERGYDTFGMDTRKQQGFSRYLGTRDVLGRIDITGPPDKFDESTSRDQGLIKTQAYFQLRDLFLKKVLVRLEQYVVGVSWEDKLDQDEEGMARMETDSSRSRIVRIVSGLARSKDVEILEYNERLVDIVDERSSQFESTLEHLKELAQWTGNRNLAARAAKAEKRYRELKRAEEEARQQAERERRAREEAERKAREERDKRAKAEEEREVLQRAYEEEKKRNLFLSSVSSLDYDTVLNLHHQIGIYSSAIHHLVELNMDKLKHREEITEEDLVDMLETVSFKNQQVLAISRLATRANFRLDSEAIETDLIEYLRQYIETVCVLYTDHVQLSVLGINGEFRVRFKPIELSMVVDNLVNNAEKAGATEVCFDFVMDRKDVLEVTVTDDGDGLEGSVVESDRIFEKGFSTTEGSGLGLYHVRQMVNEMGGSIEVDSEYDEGVRFVLRFVK